MGGEIRVAQHRAHHCCTLYDIYEHFKLKNGNTSHPSVFFLVFFRWFHSARAWKAYKIPHPTGYNAFIFQLYLNWTDMETQRIESIVWHRIDADVWYQRRHLAFAYLRTWCGTRKINKRNAKCEIFIILNREPREKFRQQKMT